MAAQEPVDEPRFCEPRCVMIRGNVLLLRLWY
jgi:hypothetical protein